ncbi:MAG: urease accessory UreF family protein [Verrucomicrobiota bacterium]
MGSEVGRPAAEAGPWAWEACLAAGEAGAWALAAGGGVGGGGRMPATAAELEAWLTGYQTRWLVAREWPVVLAAWGHAQRGEARELAALDRAWGGELGGHPWAEASLHVGRRQLNRLRPLRDLRVVQRLVAAVDSGAAAGWHPVVYGVMLSAFCLPLRQGLMHYATQTLTGLADRVPASAQLTEGHRRAILEGALGSLSPALAPWLPGTAGDGLALA